MTKPPLSPATQVIWDAFNEDFDEAGVFVDYDQKLAAALRAAQPEPEGLPPGYIDAEHTGHDREMLEIFYRACRSEGGTADEIHLRGLRAVIAADRARWARLHHCPTHGQQPENAWGCPECVREMRQQLAQPEPEGPTDEDMNNLADDLLGIVLPEGSGARLLKRALELWGRPAIEPVPNSQETLS